MITFVSKSGTNSYHDRPPTSSQRHPDAVVPLQRSVYKQNDFGVTLVEPLQSQLYNGRDRTFFFVSYELSESHRRDAWIAERSEMYKGDFSNWVNSANKQLMIYTTADRQRHSYGAHFRTTRFPLRGSAPSARASSHAEKVLPNRTDGSRRGAGQLHQKTITSHKVVSPRLRTDKGAASKSITISGEPSSGFFYNKTAFTRNRARAVCWVCLCPSGTARSQSTTLPITA